LSGVVVVKDVEQKTAVKSERPACFGARTTATFSWLDDSESRYKAREWVFFGRCSLSVERERSALNFNENKTVYP